LNYKRAVGNLAKELIEQGIDEKAIKRFTKEDGRASFSKPLDDCFSSD
jgi:hypothetical protein